MLVKEIRKLGYVLLCELGVESKLFANPLTGRLALVPHLKIFRAVVVSDSVDVVNVFVRGQRATDHLAHHQTMLSDVPYA